MEIGRHIDALERAGLDFVDAAEKAGFDAPVPTCPEWTVRELVQHVGYVHRWAATYVRECRTVVLTDDEEEAAVGPMPGDADLVAWFQAGHTELVDLLRAAPGDLTCWHFLPAPSPLAFWARRQAHETTIHRADLQGAVGTIGGVEADVGVDGIDELLMGFYGSRGGRLRAEGPCTLSVGVTDGARCDGPHAWTVRMGPEGAEISRGAPDAADCTLRGPASDLYLALWNRRATADLHVDGDPAVLDLWRSRATIRWT
ncbi:maleylpyruvate isomerase family mycothiol-dependent enzyme [Dactylosporangium fulvum]|uniref:Maleylpyruvate isomerase family mycothiol-dependent enzyme n=1 Tax=Dactylosporangium fulvum TaxID=53359 RepID=A0ABY5W1S3_9ACTN|nr:maleylpyruvate isomerase family mycothiol-dependent enzyme [Dactylosporangium fulvum]UWP83977.1 maleylpyruvate isomerase family mycothiol-dependent enzyme [Dactylosporangium fulvum]